MFEVTTGAISTLEEVLDLLSRTFVQRALIVGVLLAVCTSLLGVTLVLKRYSMIGDGLSHVGFGALAIALAFGWAPLQVSIPMVMVAAFFMLRLSESSKIKGDAAIALVSSSSLAIGIIVIRLATGTNQDVCNFMFGNIYNIEKSDVYLNLIIAPVVMVLYVLFYNKIFITTFDESFAKASGVKTGIINTLIAMLTALAIVAGIRAAGAMLISSFIIFPALTAMRVCHSFKSVVIFAAVTSVVCSVLGILATLIFNAPASASMVVINLIVFLSVSLIGILRKGRTA